MKLAIGLLAALLSISTPAPAKRAAPAVIILTGKPLTKRVVLSDWWENLRLISSMSRIVATPAESLRARPSINVAMYWGHSKEFALTQPDTVTPLAASNGGQRGTYYPRFRGRPALWEFGTVGMTIGSVRVVEAAGSAILKQHGVPVEMP